MFCKYCGKEIPDGSAFCPECGQKLNNPEYKPEREKSGISQKLGKVPTILVGVIVVAALLFLILLVFSFLVSPRMLH